MCNFLLANIHRADVVLYYRFPHTTSIIILLNSSAFPDHAFRLCDYLLLLSSLLPDTSCREEFKTFGPVHFPSKQWFKKKKHFKVSLCLFDAGIS